MLAKAMLMIFNCSYMKERDPPHPAWFDREPPSWQARYENYPPEMVKRIESVLRQYGRLSSGDVVRMYFQYMSANADHVEALASLPENNLVHARAVYIEFAENLNPGVRDEIVMYLPNLCRADHDTGVILWDHLIRDPELSVRRTANSEIADYLEPLSALQQSGSNEDQQLTGMGLTWRDVACLSRAYVEAERWPHKRYQPGLQRRRE